MKLHLEVCKQQQEDINKILSAAEEVIAMALALNQQGSMGYPLFIQARDDFRILVQDISEKYRLVEFAE